MTTPDPGYRIIDQNTDGPKSPDDVWWQSITGTWQPVAWPGEFYPKHVYARRCWIDLTEARKLPSGTPIWFRTDIAPGIVPGKTLPKLASRKGFVAIIRYEDETEPPEPYVPAAERCDPNHEKYRHRMLDCECDSQPKSTDESTGSKQPEPAPSQFKFKVGDVVDAVPPFALASLSGIYDHAVVVSTEPFALSSLEGDMIWTATLKPEKVIYIGAANRETWKKAFDRWERECKRSSSFTYSPAHISSNWPTGGIAAALADDAPVAVEELRDEATPASAVGVGDIPALGDAEPEQPKQERREFWVGSSPSQVATYAVHTVKFIPKAWTNTCHVREVLPGDPDQDEPKPAVYNDPTHIKAIVAENQELKYKSWVFETASSVTLNERNELATELQKQMILTNNLKQAFEAEKKAMKAQRQTIKCEKCERTVYAVAGHHTIPGGPPDCPGSHIKIDNVELSAELARERKWKNTFKDLSKMQKEIIESQSKQLAELEAVKADKLAVLESFSAKVTELESVKSEMDQIEIMASEGAEKLKYRTAELESVNANRVLLAENAETYHRQRNYVRQQRDELREWALAACGEHETGPVSDETISKLRELCDDTPPTETEHGCQPVMQSKEECEFYERVDPPKKEVK